jgi:hypothetical protein
LEKGLLDQVIGLHNMDENFYFNITFNGTKQQFVEFFRNFINNRKYRHNDPLLWRFGSEVYPNVDDDYIVLWDFRKDRKTLASIKVQSLPRDRSLLIVALSGTRWQEYHESWEILLQAMIDQDWVEPQTFEKPDEYASDISKPEWLPKRKTTIEEWKSMYDVIVKTKQQYIDDYGSLDLDDPNVKIDDLRDAIAAERGKKPSARIVYYVIKAGDEGLLNN